MNNFEKIESVREGDRIILRIEMSYDLDEARKMADGLKLQLEALEKAFGPEDHGSEELQVQLRMYREKMRALYEALATVKEFS